MRTLLDGLRALLYASGFFVFFGWIALKVRSYDRNCWFAFPNGTVTLGTVLMFVGGLLALLCAGTFVVRGRGTPAPFDPPRQFVAVGPYQYVRNPMYIGGLTVLLGLGLYLRSYSILFMLLGVMFLVYLFVIFYEEPTLKRNFGTTYEAYCKSVARWTPRLHHSGGSQPSG